MKVSIMYRNSFDGGNGQVYGPKTVVIGDNCPVCGEPRGKPEFHSYWQDGESVVVSTWNNPCGHVDLYRDVWKEHLRLIEERGAE